MCEIVILHVPQQPKGNGRDCPVYLLTNMEIVLDTIAEVVTLGQNKEYTVSIHFFQFYKLNFLVTLLW